MTFCLLSCTESTLSPSENFTLKGKNLLSECLSVPLKHIKTFCFKPWKNGVAFCTIKMIVYKIFFASMFTVNVMFIFLLN